MQILKEEVKKDIFEASKKLFLEFGFQNTSMKAIAEKANVSKSNLYNYFKGKEDIFYSLTDNTAHNIEKATAFFVGHKFSESFGSEEFIVMMSQNLCDLISNNRENFLLVMDHSKGTKYENLKKNIIYSAEVDFAEYLKNHGDAEDLLIAHIIVFNLIEGFLEIARNLTEKDKIYRNIYRLIEYHVKGTKMLINN